MRAPKIPIKRQRLLKKYLDQDLRSYGCNPGVTKRQTILNDFENWASRKRLNKYIDQNIKEPDKVQNNLIRCK